MTCFVESFDSLGASSRASAQVTVVKLNVPNYTRLQKVMTSKLSLFTDTPNQLAQVAGAIMSTINRAGVDCSLVTSLCPTLNREACSRTSNTCGWCKSGYVGVGGDDNSPCFANTSSLALAIAEDKKNPTSTHLKLKSCPNACSGKGTCTYVHDITGRPLAPHECSQFSLECVAVCECDEGYRGTSCSLSLSEFLTNQNLRTKLLGVADTLVNEGDPIATNVESWLDILSGILQRSDEIKPSLINPLIGLLERLLYTGVYLSLTPDKLVKLLEAADTIVKVLSTASIGSNTNLFEHKRSLLSTSSPPSSSSSSSSFSPMFDPLYGLFDNFTDYITRSQLSPGEIPFSYVGDSFRISSTTVTYSRGLTIDLYTPVTEFELLSGVIPYRITVSPMEMLPTSSSANKLVDLTAIVLKEKYISAIPSNVLSSFLDPNGGELSIIHRPFLTRDGLGQHT